MSNDITIVSNDNFNMKTTNPNTKDKLGVTALIAIMEPATESQFSRAYKQPLRSRPSNKIKVLLESGSDGDLYVLQKGKYKPFPYLTRQALQSCCMSYGVSKQMEEASSNSNSLSILQAESTRYNLIL